MVYRGAEQSRDLILSCGIQRLMLASIVMSTVKSPDKNPDIKPVRDG